MGGMAGDSEYNACLDNINELDRLGDALQAIGSELKKPGITKSGLVARAEDLTEDGRILSQETGQYLKNKLQSRSLDRQTRAQLERLGKQFQTVGNKFEIVSRQVLEQLRNVNDREGGALGDEEAGAWAGDERGGGGRSAQQTQLREPLLDDSQMQHQIQNALDRSVFCLSGCVRVRVCKRGDDVKGRRVARNKSKTDMKLMRLAANGGYGLWAIG